jgi:hypothetical protein
VPVAGAIALKVPVNVRVYVPLLEFLAVTEETTVVPLTTTELGRAQLVFEAAGDTLHFSARD